jgi:hypothetical protein
MCRDIRVRKTTLAEADDEARDRAFWETIDPVERFLQVFRMSEEAHALSGKLPENTEGRSRSVARVLRA